MSKWVDSTGMSKIASAVCDRCKMSMPYMNLRPDPNAPGVFACQECVDLYDPWRLPPRYPEDISLEHPRPDTPLNNPTPTLPGQPGFPITA